MAAQAPRRTLMQLWKQGWDEIPAVMFSSIFFGIGLVGLPIYNYYYYTRDIGNHRYKTRYVVYRPDDPRVERIKKFPDSPQPTRTP